MRTTRLWKCCPRCKRLGEVLRDPLSERLAGDSPRFTITWRGKRASAAEAVCLGELLMADFGCGCT